MSSPDRAIDGGIRAESLRSDVGGPTYLGFHGWVGGFDTFRPLAAELASGSFISLDLPGYGRSRAPARWECEQVLDQLQTYVESQDLRNFVLIGNCSGAVMAFLLAPLVQERLAALVLVEPFGYLPWYFKIFTFPLLGPFLYYFAFRSRFGRAIVSRFTGDKTEGASLGDDYLRVAPATTIGYLRMLGRHRLDDTAFDLEVPVLFVDGARTFAAVTETVESWIKALPNADRLHLEQAGHLLLQDHAAAVVASLPGQSAGA